jgi:hypothetical protein
VLVRLVRCLSFAVIFVGLFGAAARAQTGTISGTVVAEGTGTPLANARVSAYLGTMVMGEASTNASGQYSIVGLPAGRYRVRTDVAPTNFVDEWHDGQCLACPGTRTTLRLNAGESLAGVNFSLVAGGTITGAMTCGQGSVGQTPPVDAFDSTGRLIRTFQPPRAFLAPGGTITCDGATPTIYTLTGLPAGQYFLLARDTPVLDIVRPWLNASTFVDQLYGGGVCITTDCDVRTGTPVTVTAGATTSGIDFVLRHGGGFTFTGTSQQHVIKLYDARGVEVVRAVGPADASFFLYPVGQLPPGIYYVTMDGLLNGGVVCVDCPPTAGSPLIVNPDLTINAEPTFTTPQRRISGTITNAAGGAPLSSITVELLSGSGTVVRRTTTNTSGNYTIDKLTAGIYYAKTVNDQGFIDEAYPNVICGACDPRSGTPIVVPSGTDVTSIDFTLAAGGVISGVVSDSALGPIADVPVSVFGGSNVLAAVTRTSATGQYSATLPAATYKALAGGTAGNGAEIYSELPCTSTACNPASGTPIPVTAGSSTSGIDFTLTSCNAMSLSPTLLASGVVGRTYRQVLSVVGGSGPFVFDVTDGGLPLGVSLDRTTGVLEGTPTVGGRTSFRVSALAGNGCSSDRSFAVDIQGCPFTLSPQAGTVPAAGGTMTVTIANGCGSHQIVETTSWLSAQSSAPNEVTITVDANSSPASRVTSVAIGRRAFEVRQMGTISYAPIGLLELPAEGAQVSGAIAVGGWALDDIEVTRVSIYRDSVAGEAPGVVFIGDAVFIPGARPDVKAAFPQFPLSDRAGFGSVVLTNTLPNQGNGTYRLHVYVEDADGNRVYFGSRTIVVANAASQAPFGTIDTPLQGGTASGESYVNFGWALTPQPGIIPTDGSTIQVIVDGAPIGTANYNFFRPDVSNQFPGLANSGGPVGYRIIDTTALAEGLHTISWLVADSRPAISGLGSRYFTVANSADAQTASVTAAEIETAAAAATDVAKPLGAAPTPDAGRRVESLATAATSDDARVLTLAPMERLELALNDLVEADAACSATWAGYLLKDKVLSDLPVGASLDPAGTFFWQTGPGFAGKFPLVFVRTNCRGEKQQVALDVTIPNR